MELQDLVVNEFENQFGDRPAAVIRAPGRVNLIGEHTDYNDGFVLPMAIDRAIWIALRPLPGETVRVYSHDFGDTQTFSFDEVEKPREDFASSGWIEYLKGVAWVLRDAGHKLQAWEGVLVGDVPVGAGLSSSAALEMATMRAFAALGDWPWDVPAMALLGQRAENQWVGVNCGIMDQMISAAGQKDHALLLDCRSMQTELVPLPPETAVIVLDTTTRRGLVDSAYNERRRQCEEAAEHFAVKALRDISTSQLRAESGKLDALTEQRARHVISENERTLQAVAAMRAGDAHTLGGLMDASHVSLRDDFEVSSPALDAMVACAHQAPGCYGARMTGAGFGGCAVALVEAQQVDSFSQQVASTYQVETGHQAQIYACMATDGAAIVNRAP